MFRNDYQGGQYFDVFLTQGPNPLSKFKVTKAADSTVKNEFDTSLRSFVIVLQGDAAQSNIALPRKSSQSLHLTQGLLVFQLAIPLAKSFALEVTIVDSTSNKRRLLLSTSFREVIVTSLHMKMPASFVKQGLWVNLCMDLPKLVAGAFPGKSFHYIDCIKIHANCSLRRIFTLNEGMLLNGNRLDRSTFKIPDNLSVDNGSALTQVIDMDVFMESNIAIRSGTGGQRSTLTAENTKQAKCSLQEGMTRSACAHYSDGKTLGKIELAEERSSARRYSCNGKESPPELVCDRKVFTRIGTNLLKAPCETFAELSVTGVSQIKAEFQPKPPKAELRRGRVRSADIKGSKISEHLKRATLSKSANSRVEHVAAAEVSQKQSSCYHGERTKSVSGENLVDSDSQAASVRASGFFDIETKHLVDSGVVLSFPTTESCNADTIPENEQSSKTDKLLPADDAVEADYLRQHLLSPTRHGRYSSISSSLSSSSNSDTLYLYSSKPREIGDLPRPISSDDEPATSEPSKHGGAGRERSRSHVLRSSPTTTSGRQSSAIERNSSLFAKEKAPSSYHLSEYCSQTTGVVSNESSKGAPPSTANEKVDNGVQLDGSVVNAECGLVGPAEDIRGSLVHVSADSDTMSWMQDSLMSRQAYSPRRLLNNKLNLQQKVQATFGSVIGQSRDIDSDDGVSDMSDDTSSISPGPHILNYRYQDEMKKVCATLDLSATIPDTPFVGDQASSRDLNNNDIEVEFNAASTTNPRKHSGVHHSREDLLDLLYDPVLGYYYDPKTHNYYELT